MLRFTPIALAILTMGATLVIPSTRAMSATELPANWFMAGSHPENIVPDIRDRTMHLTSQDFAKINDFGTAMQTISSARYVGKTVRLAANVKSSCVVGWAGLWMRIDGQNRQILAFDNMQTRPITGTTGWRNYSVVLPVDTSAIDIAFGILLAGPGDVWVKDVSFQSEGQGATSTATLALPTEPNLDLTSPQWP